VKQAYNENAAYFNALTAAETQIVSLIMKIQQQFQWDRN